MGALIIAKNLVKRFGKDKEILRGASLTVEEGELVAVYGHSGCGKTTLLNILGGLDRPSSGSLSIGEDELTTMSENELASFRLSRIGFVFQDYNLLGDLTVRENLDLPLNLSGRLNEGRVGHLLQVFGIDHISDEQANKISGGEAQRAAIARAMMNEPSILLADEPTGNLDESNAGKVMEMFRLARREFGATVVLATHDRNLTKAASRTMCLREGLLESYKE